MQRAALASSTGRRARKKPTVHKRSQAERNPVCFKVRQSVIFLQAVREPAFTTDRP
jgi:hypothetical protein